MCTRLSVGTGVMGKAEKARRRVKRSLERTPWADGLHSVSCVHIQEDTLET